MLEPGRSLVGNAGLCVTEVLVKGTSARLIRSRETIADQLRNEQSALSRTN